VYSSSCFWGAGEAELEAGAGLSFLAAAGGAADAAKASSSTASVPPMAAERRIIAQEPFPEAPVEFPDRL